MSKGKRNRERRRQSVRVSPTADGGAILTTGLGVHEEVAQHGVRPDEIRPGEHVWCVTAAWRVDPAKFRDNVAGSGFGILDHENMLALSGPGCFVCEQQLTPEIAARPCPGDPSGWTP